MVTPLDELADIMRAVPRPDEPFTCSDLLALGKQTAERLTCLPREPCLTGWMLLKKRNPAVYVLARAAAGG